GCSFPAPLLEELAAFFPDNFPENLRPLLEHLVGGMPEKEVFTFMSELAGKGHSQALEAVQDFVEVSIRKERPYAELQDLMTGVLERTMQGKIDVATYTWLRELGRENPFFAHLQERMVATLYFKAAETSLTCEEGAVLSLILRDEEVRFFPAPEIIACLKIRMGENSRESFQAKRIYNRLIASVLAKVDAEVEAENYTEAYKLLQDLYETSLENTGEVRSLTLLGPKEDQDGKAVLEWINFTARLCEAKLFKAIELVSAKMEETAHPELAAYCRGLVPFSQGNYPAAALAFRKLLDSEKRILVYNRVMGKDVSLRELAAIIFLYSFANAMNKTSAVAREAQAWAEGLKSPLVLRAAGDAVMEHDPTGAIALYKKALLLDPLFVLPAVNLLPVYRKMKDNAAYLARVDTIKRQISAAIAGGRDQQFLCRNIYDVLIDEHAKTKGKIQLSVKGILDLLESNFPHLFNSARGNDGPR
ncbi:MAG: hypothetical protein WCT39_05435, partial [Candidatus Margulisiibacteriota bacterium]